jgi:glycosyltransferase involved in cell wall biosynthesis
MILSVLLPAYNSSRTLKASVLSTLRAMPQESELLVHLDACTDDSMAILNEINDPRLVVSESKSNLGLSESLNLLLTKSNGKFVARMDHDDICLPGRFKRQIKAIQSHNCDIVFSQAIVWKPGLIPLLIPVPKFRLEGKNLDLALLRSNPLVHPTMFARRSSLIALGGYRKVAAEDYDLWLRARAAGQRIIRTGGYGIFYRIHATQMTKDLAWSKQVEEDQNLRQSIAKFAKVVFGIDADENMASSEIRKDVWNKALKQHQIGVFDTFRILGLIGGARRVLTGRRDD